METFKEFESSDLSCLEDVLGKKLDDIFLVPVAGLLSEVDMFVINFGENLEVRFHVFAAIRVIEKNKILLTSSDYYFDKDRNLLSLDEQEITRKNGFQNTLLEQNINNLKVVLKDSVVIRANSNSIGDIFLEFSNGVVIEIRINAIYNDFECYRIIIGTEENNVHHFVEYNNGKLLYSAECYSPE